MTQPKARCLVLACGNTLREDDGAGPWLAEWAEERFRNEAGVRVLARQQWTPELAEEIAGAEDVLFIDCSANSAPGLVCLAPVTPSTHSPRLLGHQLSAADLLALGRELYASLPRTAMLLTVGSGSLGLREGFSGAVQAALPDASQLLEETVLRMLADSDTPQA